MSVFTDLTRRNNANFNYLKVLANKDRIFDLNKEIFSKQRDFFYKLNDKAIVRISNILKQKRRTDMMLISSVFLVSSLLTWSLFTG
jgi:hypothetical protein